MCIAEASDLDSKTDCFPEVHFADADEQEIIEEYLDVF